MKKRFALSTGMVQVKGVESKRTNDIENFRENPERELLRPAVAL
jgi:hypothetical protein